MIGSLWAFVSLRRRLPAPMLRRLGVALKRDLWLGTIAERLAHVYGGRIAFHTPEPSVLAGAELLSFADVGDVVSRLATAMRASGVSAGETVAIVPSNGVDYFLTFLATIRAGAVAVPVNPLLKPTEVAGLVERSGATTLVADRHTLTQSIGDGEMPKVLRRLSIGPVHGWTDIAASMAAVREVLPPAARPDDDVVAVIHTSGTTGYPKGARLTSGGLLALPSFVALNPAGPPGSVRRAVTALPMAHVMGISVGLALLCAGIENRAFPHFDPRRILDEIETERADLFVGVPAMYRALLDAGAEGRDLRSVKIWLSSADVMPPDLARRFQSFGRLAGPLPSIFVEIYGMVESSGAAILSIAPPPPAPTGHTGIAIPPYHVKVVDEEGNERPKGALGELCLQGPGILRGYQDDAAATSAALQGGWLRTGDLARVGPFGVVSFAGRMKDVLKVGGYSVFPAEIEEEIRRHPKVADVAVLGVEDAVKGQVPVAAVVPVPGEKLAPSVLEAWAAHEMASYRRPRRWIVVSELPRGVTGKADKTAIARLF